MPSIEAYFVFAASTVMQSNNVTQLTQFKNNPVRHLSASKDNTLCFTWDGEIYTLKNGEAPKSVNDFGIVNVPLKPEQP